MDKLGELPMHGLAIADQCEGQPFLGAELYTRGSPLRGAVKLLRLRNAHYFFFCCVT